MVTPPLLWPRVLVPEATAGLSGFCDTICGRWENLILDLMGRAVMARPAIYSPR